MNAPQTHFGFESIPPEEKAGRVRGVFSAVAPAYDIMNDLMSMGAHRLWKEAAIAAMIPRGGMRILDLAGGTGDMSFRMLKRAPDAAITLADINPDMLAEGKRRAIDRNILHGIEWTCADAEALPFPDQHFDACIIAFGIRNVTNIDKALSEIHRVLKTGGHFLCLEFSPVSRPWLKNIYDWYSFQVIPRIGKRVAGDDTPYRYLVESIRRFPTSKRFAQMMKAAGLSRISARPMSGGIVYLHSGWRI